MAPPAGSGAPSATGAPSSSTVAIDRSLATGPPAGRPYGIRATASISNRNSSRTSSQTIVERAGGSVSKYVR